MTHILYDQNRISPEIITEYLDLIHKILSRDLRHPQVKKLTGLYYQNNDVFRAKTDRKERLIYTYTTHQGQKTLLILRVLDDHNYDKVKQQLRGHAAVASEELIDNSPVVSENNAEKTISLLPSVSYNQMTLVLDESQQQALQQKTPLLLAGVPGAGKTVLLYNLMLRESNYTDKEEELTRLFISQSESLLASLKRDYEQSPLEERPVVQFRTWNQLLKEQYPHLNEVRQEEFARFVKNNKLLKEESIQEVHYELSLIVALGVDDYQNLAARQSYYAGNPSKKAALIQLLKSWQHHLAQTNQYDPMITRLNPEKTTKFDRIFCDESQNLPPVALLDFILYAKDKRLVICLDTEQCLLSSPFIHNCVKTLLQKYYGSYNEHILSRTWRCPPNIVSIAEHLMDKKHELDSGNRRIYNHIQSAHSENGIVTWVNDSVFTNLSQYGHSASTVVLTEQLSPEERADINKKLATNNILTSSQAIGLDFRVVILWKPFSQNPHLKSLYQKWQNNKTAFAVSLQEINALNALYVSLTRSQKAVFIYETNKPALRFGEYLLGALPLNQLTFTMTAHTPENERKDWEVVIKHHLAENRIDIARELMKFHLKMDETSIEQRIKAFHQAPQADATLATSLQQLQIASPLAVAPSTSEQKKTPLKKIQKQKIQKEEASIKEKSLIIEEPKKIDPIYKYFEGLLKNPTISNLHSLFSHKKARSYLFDYPLKNGSCLLAELMKAPGVNQDYIINYINQYWDKISPGFTAEVLSKPYPGKDDSTIFFQFSLTFLGCTILYKLLQEKPELANNISAETLCRQQIAPANENINKSVLFNLTTASIGRDILFALTERNPELKKNITAASFFHVLPHENGQYANTSAFSWLAQASKGCMYLLSLININPTLFKLMPAEILSLGQTQAYNSLPSFCHLCNDPNGRVLLHHLFEINPELIKTISKNLLFKKYSKNAPHLTPFFHLANCHLVGHEILTQLFTVNPALADNISNQNFVVSNIELESSTSNIIPSPFFALSIGKQSEGRALLYRMILRNPKLANYMSEGELFGIYNNEGSCISAFHWLCSDAFGLEFLSCLFTNNPALAHTIQGNKLSAIQKRRFENDKECSSLAALAATTQGCKLLNELLKQQPQLAQEIIAEALYCPDSENKTVLYYLSLCKEGCKFFNQLIALNPDLLRTSLFQQAYFLSPDSNKLNAPAYLIHQHPKGPSILKQVLLTHPTFNPRKLSTTPASQVGLFSNRNKDEADSASEELNSFEL